MKKNRLKKAESDFKKAVFQDFSDLVVKSFNGKKI